MELTKGRHLIKWVGGIFEIEVLEISEFAMKIRWIESKKVEWLLKKSVFEQWQYVESIQNSIERELMENIYEKILILDTLDVHVNVRASKTTMSKDVLFKSSVLIRRPVGKYAEINAGYHKTRKDAIMAAFKIIESEKPVRTDGSALPT